MRLNGLDLNLLVALDALLSEASVSRAAERLNISQSGMSGALSRLRVHFEDDLLIQIGGRMRLSPMAQSLTEPLAGVLQAMQAITASRPRFDPGTAQRHFTIGSSDYASAILIAEVSRAATRHGAGISVGVRQIDTVVVNLLEKGALDFLITADQGLRSDHPSEVLFEDEFVCMCWSGNRAVKKTIGLKQYQQMPHVMVEFGSEPRPSVFDAWFDQTYGERRIAASVLNFGMLPEFVIGTGRIATAHKRLAKLWAKRFPIRICPLPFKGPAFYECVQWHRGADRDPAIPWFRGLLREVASGI
jgi:LysR family transcriptional regulator, nod-box dependent transcriptional activator